MKSIFVLFIALLSVMDCIAQSAEIPEEDIGYRRALLEQINDYRLEKGLKRLRLDPALTLLAKNHSQMMFQKQKVSHHNFDERFKQAGSSLCVENVGWNYSSPLHIFEGWRRSSGHNQNMLKKEVNRVGIAEIGKYVTYFACR